MVSGFKLIAAIRPNLLWKYYIVFLSMSMLSRAVRDFSILIRLIFIRFLPYFVIRLTARNIETNEINCFMLYYLCFEIMIRIRKYRMNIAR